MDELRFWVWLSLVFPYGSQKPAEILSHLDSPEEFYRLRSEEMLSLGCLTERDITMAKSVGLERADKILRDCSRLGISVVSYNDPLYPKRLRQIYGSPMVLYYKGDISGIDNSVVIGVVGTRKAVDYTARVTHTLCREMASAGAIIVSGCAVGIDTAAHMGALDGNGRTIAVLACGLDVNYPAESHDMKKEILKRGGALLTELPPGTQSNSRIFPARNRLIAGLSLGVLVTHAPLRSGALLTAEHALEQGKEVFCVPPPDIFDPTFFGVRRYLREGAIPVFSTEDILGLYSGAYADVLELTRIVPAKPAAEPKTTDAPAPKKSVLHPAPSPVKEPAKQMPPEKKEPEIIFTLDEEHRRVYRALGEQPKFVDELTAVTGLPVGALLSILTEFEILGLAKAVGGRRYQLCE